MLSLETYKVIHLIGIFVVFGAIAGVCVHAMNGGTRQDNAGRKFVGLMHGVGAVVILVAGFGMMARLGAMHFPFPGWVWAKLVIWVGVSALLMMPYRHPALAKPILIGLPLLGGLAAYLALFKPF